LVDVLKEAVEAGVRLFQYRDKHASMRDAYHLATALRRAAADAGALFIVNDRCDLALAVEADGVHLGQSDLPLAEARVLLGPGNIIGVSTHNANQVKEVAAGGPDYLGFGPIFGTWTKQDHETVVGVEGLRAIRPLAKLPLFAIGGITVDTVAQVKQAGADGVAVISAILNASDMTKTIRDFMARLS
jgi:thiamine-phosphate pyrophosphorylase